MDCRLSLAEVRSCATFVGPHVPKYSASMRPVAMRASCGPNDGAAGCWPVSMRIWRRRIWSAWAEKNPLRSSLGVNVSLPSKRCPRKAQGRETARGAVVVRRRGKWNSKPPGRCCAQAIRIMSGSPIAMCSAIGMQPCPPNLIHKGWGRPTHPIYYLRRRIW